MKALARAFRWRRILDEGVHATLEDLAKAKGVHATYVSRVLRLTLLAPDIVEAILDGRQPAGLQLDDLLEAFPLDWEGHIECGRRRRECGLRGVGAAAAGRQRHGQGAGGRSGGGRCYTGECATLEEPSNARA